MNKETFLALVDVLVFEALKENTVGDVVGWLHVKATQLQVSDAIVKYENVNKRKEKENGYRKQ